VASWLSRQLHSGQAGLQPTSGTSAHLPGLLFQGLERSGLFLLLGLHCAASLGTAPRKSRRLKGCSGRAASAGQGRPDCGQGYMKGAATRRVHNGEQAAPETRFQRRREACTTRLECLVVVVQLLLCAGCLLQGLGLAAVLAERRPGVSSGALQGCRRRVQQRDDTA